MHARRGRGRGATTGGASRFLCRLLPRARAAATTKPNAHTRSLVPACKPLRHALHSSHVVPMPHGRTEGVRHGRRRHVPTEQQAAAAARRGSGQCGAKKRRSNKGRRTESVNRQGGPARRRSGSSRASRSCAMLVALVACFVPAPRTPRSPGCACRRPCGQRPWARPGATSLRRRRRRRSPTGGPDPYGHPCRRRQS